MAYDPQIFAAASSAARSGMTSGWAWILVEALGSLPGEVQGWLCITRLALPDSSRISSFFDRVQDSTEANFEMNVSTTGENYDPYKITLFNSIMLYAHAVTKLLMKGGFDLSDGQTVTEAIRTTQFSSVGGTFVSVDQNGDIDEQYALVNYKLEAGKLVSVPVGIYNSTLDTYLPHSTAIIWPGGTSTVPTDFVEGELVLKDYLNCNLPCNLMQTFCRCVDPYCAAHAIQWLMGCGSESRWRCGYCC
jgi:hypothetical protein